ncbi:HK97 family phage prohead protease [Streptomyces sp. NRRL F-5135]|uniref:HK97 family phage prohead protease n=1 Tax=Streptomyces sp. NRRL F-5135 TaxID=1463858 RepID=UPI00099C1FD1|nr:HK97 family phage prohead protease [Streptomyces sp. NRRL F-5135]
MRTREVRAFPLTDLTIRAADDTAARLHFTGRAIVYDSLSEDMGGWRERIVPGAATRTLAQGPDVRFLINHDPNLLLARTAAGTATLTEDDAGVLVDAEMADVSYARDLAVSLERGDITQMSFGFWVTADGWQGNTHEVFGVDLDGGDVSVVTYPAFAATSAELRSAAARRTGQQPAPEPEAVTRALAEVRAGRVLSAANRQLVADAHEALGALLEAADRTAPGPQAYPHERARHRLRELELLAQL